MPRRPRGPSESTREPVQLGSGSTRGPDFSALAGRTADFSAGTGSELEMILANRVALAGLPLGETQRRIVPGRLWRFDRVWAEQRIAVEVQGGTFSASQQGHNRGSKIENDCRKISAAAALGWRVLPVTRKMIEDGTAVDLIRRALEREA